MSHDGCMAAKAQVPEGQGPGGRESPERVSPGQPPVEQEPAEQEPAEQEPEAERRRPVHAGTIRAQARRAEHAADTREALVAAARLLFARDGFDDTGTEQIVAEARVTRGALYHTSAAKPALSRAGWARPAGAVG